MTFGNWVRDKRVEMRLTAAECAERAKVSKPVWSRWENDDDRRRGATYQPRRDTVLTIARALQVPQNEALIAAGYSPFEVGDAMENDAVIAEIEQRVPPDKRSLFRLTMRKQAEQIAELLCV